MTNTFTDPVADKNCLWERKKKKSGNISSFLRRVSARVGGTHRYLVCGWWLPQNS